jgi:hypothetical protein
MKGIIFVCLTLWAIVKECLVVDLIEYDARVDVINRAHRVLHPSDAKFDHL